MARTGTLELRPTLTRAQIVNEIKLGHAKWRPNTPSGPIKQVTVFGYDLYYRGQPGNADLDQQQKFVDPYVMIYASCWAMGVPMMLSVTAKCPYSAK